MIKEIRIGMGDVLNAPVGEYQIMNILKNRGFPVEGTSILKPKTGLTYFEFHDYATDEIVIQWEE